MRRAEAGCCAICRRIEAGVGYSPPPRHSEKARIIWTCEADIGRAKAVWHMRNDTLARIEREALLAAGDKAGDFLDQMGKTDLAKLSPEEWEAFLSTILEEYGAGVRTRLDADSVPF